MANSGDKRKRSGEVAENSVKRGRSSSPPRGVKVSAGTEKYMAAVRLVREFGGTSFWHTTGEQSAYTDGYSVGGWIQSEKWDYELTDAQIALKVTEFAASSAAQEALTYRSDNIDHRRYIGMWRDTDETDGKTYIYGDVSQRYTERLNAHCASMSNDELAVFDFKTQDSIYNKRLVKVLKPAIAAEYSTAQQPTPAPSTPTYSATNSPPRSQRS